jgi:hypothetical protein
MPQVIVFLDENEDVILKKYMQDYTNKFGKRLSKNNAIKRILKGE